MTKLHLVLESGKLLIFMENATYTHHFYGENRVLMWFGTNEKMTIADYCN